MGFKRIEFINTTKSNQILIIVKTHQQIPSFSCYEELNKSNNLIKNKNDQKS